jgi:hypothetical protein
MTGRYRFSVLMLDGRPKLSLGSLSSDFVVCLDDWFAKGLIWYLGLVIALL